MAVDLVLYKLFILTTCMHAGTTTSTDLVWLRVGKGCGYSIKTTLIIRDRKGTLIWKSATCSSTNLNTTKFHPALQCIPHCFYCAESKLCYAQSSNLNGIPTLMVLRCTSSKDNAGECKLTQKSSINTTVLGQAYPGYLTLIASSVCLVHAMCMLVYVTWMSEYEYNWMLLVW